MPDHTTQGEATRLLAQVQQGDANAMNALIPLLYEDLRQMARRQLAREYGEPSLHATALVHELWLKLAGATTVEAGSRGHFMGIAARAMRQILVDRARRRKASKRGGESDHVTLGDSDAALEVDSAELIALDDAMDTLDDRQRRIVELKFFAGLDEVEIGQMLDISDRTVRREWTKARARLYRQIYADRDEADGPARRDGDPA